MVKANTLWHSSSQHSYRQLPDSNCMSALLESRQQECLPSLTNLGTCKFTVPFPLPGSTVGGLQSLRTQQKNESNGQLCGFVSDSCPIQNPFVGGKKSAFPCGLNGMVVPNQKGFLIFDQSENQTRLFYNFLCPTSQNPFTGNTRLVSPSLAQACQIDTTKKMILEESDTSYEKEMHEDTEEINALLDSDDEDGDKSVSDNKSDDEDDEVTSTCRCTPVQMKEGYQKQELIGLSELVEEVASSGGPNKRQKKIDGGYANKSSPVHTCSSVNLDGSHEYDARSDDLAGIEGYDCTFGYKLPKKDKIREILRVLERIIPGVKGKDPLLVIDEAIDYLRIAKTKAETIGLSFH